MTSLFICCRSCVADVCDCPEGKDCACESVRAYVSECQRHGGQIEWSEQFCKGTQQHNCILVWVHMNFVILSCTDLSIIII